MNAFDQDYDVAVSYAEDARPYVEKFAAACRKRGFRVFFDREHKVACWGLFYPASYLKIYGGASVRHVVAFISANYLRSSFPMMELKAALSQALTRDAEGYVLPVRVGDVEVPDELLGPHVGSLRAEDFSPDELAEALAQRLS